MCSRLQPFHRTHVIITLNHHIQTKNPCKQEWISNVMLLSAIEHEFDLSPITPAIIKRSLQNCSTSFSPGRDRIIYFHLRNLPCTHSFLATLFSTNLLSSQDAPPSWFQG